MPPSSALRPAITGIIDFDDCIVKKTRIDRGASFCQDDKIVHEIHEMEVITDGYQKWQGALPSFSKMEVISTLDMSRGMGE